MTEYLYKDPYGCCLRIRPSEANRCDVEMVTDRPGADIPAADLPKIVAEMYRAAGQDQPVIHEHVDDEGQGLSIVSSRFRPSTAYVEGCNGAYVTPEDLPGIVRKLYEAAGQEPPITLPRYKPDATMTRGGKVRPMLTPTGDDMEVAEARDLASWYATAADLAEADAERARHQRDQVRQLSEVIDTATSGGWSPATIAEAVLAAGYVRGGS